MDDTLRDDVSELELKPDAMRAFLAEAARRVIDHVESLGEQPAQQIDDGVELARKLAAEPLPSTPRSFEDLLEELFEQIIPVSLNTAGPGYLAYIPGGGLVHAAVADLIAGAVNRYVGIWLPAPGLVQLESNVVRWFTEILGMPQGSGGFLTTGGSLANLSAVVAARVDRLPEDFAGGRMYVSDQVHHSVTRAARIAGFPEASVRTVPSDSDFRIRIDALETMIEEDRQAGVHKDY